MPNHQYPNEQIGMQTTEAMNMDALPTREVVPHTPPLAENVAHTETEPETVETRKEEARLVKYTIGKVNDVMQWLSWVIEITLLVRFLFKLIGASPDNMFAIFLYSVTDVILIPFHGILPDLVIRQHVQAFEWATLVGMAMYGLLFLMIKRFLRIPISEPEENVK